MIGINQMIRLGATGQRQKQCREWKLPITLARHHISAIRGRHSAMAHALHVLSQACQKEYQRQELALPTTQRFVVGLQDLWNRNWINLLCMGPFNCAHSCEWTEIGWRAEAEQICPHTCAPTSCRRPKALNRNEMFVLFCVGLTSSGITALPRVPDW